MAFDYAAIPATSVPSERVFSRAGGLITKKRNRLSPKTAHCIMGFRAWMGIKEVSPVDREEEGPSHQLDELPNDATRHATLQQLLNGDAYTSRPADRALPPERRASLCLAPEIARFLFLHLFARDRRRHCRRNYWASMLSDEISASLVLYCQRQRLFGMKHWQGFRKSWQKRGNLKHLRRNG